MADLKVRSPHLGKAVHFDLKHSSFLEKKSNNINSFSSLVGSIMSSLYYQQPLPILNACRDQNMGTYTQWYITFGTKTPMTHHSLGARLRTLKWHTMLSSNSSMKECEECIDRFFYLSAWMLHCTEKLLELHAIDLVHQLDADMYLLKHALQTRWAQSLTTAVAPKQRF